MPRKVFKRYKAKTPETKGRIRESVRRYHERCRRALALLDDQAAVRPEATSCEK